MRTSDHSQPLTCDDARELISAAADGELHSGEQLDLARHLAGCPGCGAYADDVAALARQTRMRVVTADPQFVATVMSRSRMARLGRGAWIRPALAWCGVVVVAQSVRPLLFGEIGGTPTHIARHVGASALALAVGLMYAAWKPHRAHGLLPLVVALFVSTVLGTVLDTIAGDRRPGAESSHVAELVGMILLWVVAGSPGWERCRSAVRSGRGAVASTTA